MITLKGRFKPVDIEELRGLKFHQLMQAEESVEKLGLQLMSLANKAFPGLSDKERDRIGSFRPCCLGGSVSSVHPR